MNIDLGDATLHIGLKIKGLKRYGVRWHIGAPRDTIEADRVVKSPRKLMLHWQMCEGNVLYMDLMADKKVSLTAQWTDEIGNPVDAPDGATAAFDVDDPNILNITTDENGVVWAAATGTLGTAVIHGDFTTAEGTNLTGDLMVNVVAGLAERVDIVAGEPEEVTPDA